MCWLFANIYAQSATLRQHLIHTQGDLVLMQNVQPPPTGASIQKTPEM